MKLIIKAAIFLYLVVFSTLSYSADKNSNFSLKGSGLLTCSLYVQEREKQSKVYYLIGGWVEGYISAYNRFSEDTYDITSFEHTELLTKVIANHCKGNLNDRLYSVVNSILEQISVDRIQTMSDQKIITVGERTTHLYQETINRIQIKLKEKGFLKKAPNGEYDAETIGAVMDFQKSIQFEATGFPDQTTLWRLMRK